MVSRNVDVLGKLDWLTVLLFLAIAVCGWLSVCGASADIENPDLLSFATRSGKLMVRNDSLKWPRVAEKVSAILSAHDTRKFHKQLRTARIKLYDRE
jgi:hypothetical protein